jgi:hypothetical protein
MKNIIPHDYLKKMKEYFNGDIQKTYLWFNTKNPSLGQISPLEMIQKGRAKKLMEFIDSRLEGYFP